jgi:phosphohistidine swiveling domain-containing protein
MEIWWKWMRIKELSGKYSMSKIYQDYFKTELVKMGRWAAPPLDSETWHAEPTSRYFRKAFGLGKGLLAIHTANPDFQHMYTPKFYFKRLYNQIDQINRKDWRSLEKILKKFYSQVEQGRKLVSKAGRLKLENLSNEKLISIYKNNRDWVHRITIYDQFGWLAEEYWMPKMKKILCEKLGLVEGLDEYNQVLFALSKPEKISTTLRERREFIQNVTRIKEKKTNLIKAAKVLAEKFGWMPVFTYGDPWTARHYQTEFKQGLKEDLSDCKKELKRLRNYSEDRNKEFARIVRQYKMRPKDSQVFIDFGLALDARNEAEYFVSFAGFYLIPIYREISRRLKLPIPQMRFLLEEEVCRGLLGKIDVQETVKKKGKFVGWGFDREMNKREIFSPADSEKLFRFVEKHVQNVQGDDETKGMCASSGRARGRIKILHRPEENFKVNAGDVLITHATTVDYLPAMKRTAAIITEVGGLTCHAAVVSREFGIPCIVALKNAMKNFKDGDLVEVDANKGIVRLVETKARRVRKI